MLRIGNFNIIVIIEIKRNWRWTYKIKAYENFRYDLKRNSFGAFRRERGSARGIKRKWTALKVAKEAKPTWIIYRRKR